MLTKLKPTFEEILPSGSPFKNQVKCKTLLEGRLQTTSRLSFEIESNLYQYLAFNIGISRVGNSIFNNLEIKYDAD